MVKEYDFSEGKRGAVIASPGKTRITIMLDDDIIEAFRAKAESSGRGYQTMINETLRQAIDPESVPVTLRSLRRVLDELMGSRKLVSKPTVPHSRGAWAQHMVAAMASRKIARNADTSPFIAVEGAKKGKKGTVVETIKTSLPKPGSKPKSGLRSKK